MSTSEESYEVEYVKVISTFPDYADHCRSLKAEALPNQDDRAVVRSIYERVRRRLQTQLMEPLIRAMPPTYFGIYTSSEFNAFAIPTSFGMAIAMSLGIISWTLQFAFRAFSHPGFMPEIGFADGETSPPINTSPYLIPGLTSSVKPKDDIRRLAAIHLTSQVIDFVAAHEYRHLQAGHVLYMNGKGGQPVIQELAADTYQTSDSMIWQALEMDADLYASSNLLIAAIRANRAIKSTGNELFLVIPEEENAIFLAYLAIYIMVKFIEHQSISPANWEDAQHPPASVRLIMALAQTHTLHKIHLPLDESFNDTNLHSNVDKVIDIGEQFFAINGFPASYPSDWIRQVDHSRKIRNIWLMIKSDLQKCAFVDMNPGMPKSF